MNIENPETIEIHGLNTIHKLCKFGADNNMEGCTFTDIVERMFLELKKLEGCVVVPVEPTEGMVHAFEKGMLESEHFFGEFEAFNDGYKAMVEAARGGNE